MGTPASAVSFGQVFPCGARCTSARWPLPCRIGRRACLVCTVFGALPVGFRLDVARPFPFSLWPPPCPGSALSSEDFVAWTYVFLGLQASLDF